MFFKNYALAISVSLALHATVLLAMIVGWESAPIKRELKRPNYVKAQLVQLEAKSTKAQPQEDKPKIVDLTKKRKEQERLQKLAEQKKQRELQKKRELEKKKKAEADRKKKEAEEKAKAAEEKKRREAEQKRKEELQLQREQEAFEKALQQEQQALLEQAYANEAQSFIAIIQQRIINNWSRPPSARNGMECELLIKLVPTGRVVNVDVVRSSGNSLFDRSAVQAVKKAEQFPEIQKMKPEVFEQYYRELQLIFRPQDLRQ